MICRDLLSHISLWGCTYPPRACISLGIFLWALIASWPIPILASSVGKGSISADEDKKGGMRASTTNSTG